MGTMLHFRTLRLQRRGQGVWPRGGTCTSVRRSARLSCSSDCTSALQLGAESIRSRFCWRQSSTLALACCSAAVGLIMLATIWSGHSESAGPRHSWRSRKLSRQSVALCASFCSSRALQLRTHLPPER
jgi:hypothetical protein